MRPQFNHNTQVGQPRPGVAALGPNIAKAFFLACIGLFACASPRDGANISPSLKVTPTISAEATAYLEEVLTVMRSDAVLRNNLDFAAVRDSLYAYASPAEIVSDVYPAIERTLPMLRDHHSSFWSAEVVRRDFGFSEADIALIKAGTVPRIGADKVDSLRGVLDFASAKTVYTVADAPVAYLYLPEVDILFAEGMQLYADSLQALIRQHDTPENIGFVIDLRQNRGGNVVPMVVGLGPLLTVDNVVYTKDESGATRDRTYYRNGGFYSFSESESVTEPLLQASSYQLQHPRKPVALLVGRATASSAEATAAAFVGQPNARLVGQPTNGLTSTNSFKFLSDNSVLNLTIGYLADRRGQLYHQGILPDIPVAVDASGTDAELAAALAWIAEP